jgi:hypothetical protein
VSARDDSTAKYVLVLLFNILLTGFTVYVITRKVTNDWWLAHGVPCKVELQPR